MQGWSIFDLYRRFLAIAVGSYVSVHTANVLRRWYEYGRSSDRTEALLSRYMVTLVLRTRIRRFWLDFLEIGAMIAVLGYLLYLHT